MMLTTIHKGSFGNKTKVDEMFNREKKSSMPIGSTHKNKQKIFFEYALIKLPKEL